MNEDGIEKLPGTIGIATVEFEPILKIWRQRNRGVPWSEFLRRAIKNDPEVRKLAGKRYRHLVAA